MSNSCYPLDFADDWDANARVPLPESPARQFPDAWSRIASAGQPGPAELCAARIVFWELLGPEIAELVHGDEGAARIFQTGTLVERLQRGIADLVIDDIAFYDGEALVIAWPATVTVAKSVAAHFGDELERLLARWDNPSTNAVVSRSPPQRTAALGVNPDAVFAVLRSWSSPDVFEERS